MKTCTKCLKNKKEMEFYSKKTGKDGLNARCKSCVIEDTTKWPKENPEKTKLAKQEWLERNKHTEKYRGINNKKTKKYRHKNTEEWNARMRCRYDLVKSSLGFREKQKAQRLFYKAVKNKEIIRPANCSICDAEKKLDGHHSDYSKPYDVIWCCRMCHKQIHLELERKHA